MRLTPTLILSALTIAGLSSCVPTSGSGSAEQQMTCVAPSGATFSGLGSTSTPAMSSDKLQMAAATIPSLNGETVLVKAGETLTAVVRDECSANSSFQQLLLTLRD